ncbi:hypothetical protein C5167_032888 [Papaver somniferum]|uniref:Uncharacterized protein n=1 Tax=Papaver somniferum TaxID=3469 RepID=A0A4Y7KBM1_PAPSO|nr:hypothetical protein C5167_032888 [Papaver somniferum]
MVMILIRIILVFKVFLGVETIQETKEIINEMKENDPMQLLNLEVLRIVCRIQTLITQFSRRLKEWENVLGDVGQQFLVGFNVVRAAIDKHCIYTGYPYPIVKSAPYRYTVKVFSCRGTIHTLYTFTLILVLQVSVIVMPIHIQLLLFPMSRNRMKLMKALRSTLLLLLKDLEDKKKRYIPRSEKPRKKRMCGNCRKSTFHNKRYPDPPGEAPITTGRRRGHGLGKYSGL